MPERTCLVEGCGTGGKIVRGMCQRHYKAYWETRQVRPPCVIDGCGEQRRKRDWCEPHYRAWLKYGDPLARYKAPLGDPARWLTAMLVVYALAPFDVCITDWPFSRATLKGLLYPRLQWNDRVQLAHHAVLEATGRPRPPAPSNQTRHLCPGGSRAGCLTPCHLTWGTQAENEADKLRHGLSNRGARHGMSKLTEDQVRDIRRRYIKGSDRWNNRGNCRDLAAEFRVGAKYIRDIGRGQRWAWLDADEASAESV